MSHGPETNNDAHLLVCDDCGTEPLPIGSDAWKAWWYAHWTGCKGVVFDRVTAANLGFPYRIIVEHRRMPRSTGGYDEVAHQSIIEAGRPGR